MKPADLEFDNLTNNLLSAYIKRAPDDSSRFMRWFLENIFRLDRQDSDDACVDAKQDKGIDGVYVNDVTEVVYLFQTKVRQKENATLGDTDIKEFVGSLEQFTTSDKVASILDGAANDQLKQAVRRNKLGEKIEAGYVVIGVFCTNIPRNQDAIDYLKGIDHLSLYDSTRIAEEFIETEANGGIEETFWFNPPDTAVIKYKATGGVSTRIFLADALQLLHLKGIDDGSLFEQNVRLSLGNTKVNKSLIASIKDKPEHKNFPLYHNGINILCESFVEKDDGQIGIKNYMVVNGAQSLTSLNAARSTISADLKIMVKAIEVKGDTELADKITINSNNQNATKPRDMRSNHGIQQRLKKEIGEIGIDEIVYEVKRGEKNKGKNILSNEDAGLALLALDLGEPWTCHQRYRVMDDSHSKIFGRPDVNGFKIVALVKALECVNASLPNFSDQSFANYNLTRYFLAYAVCEIMKDSVKGKLAFDSFKKVITDGTLDEFIDVFGSIAGTTADDLNAEIEELIENNAFDYKSDLKNSTWCRTTAAKLKAAYKKDVKRKKADEIDILLADVI